MRMMEKVVGRNLKLERIVCRSIELWDTTGRYERFLHGELKCRFDSSFVQLLCSMYLLVLQFYVVFRKTLTLFIYHKVSEDIRCKRCRSHLPALSQQRLTSVHQPAKSI